MTTVPTSRDGMELAISDLPDTTLSTDQNAMPALADLPRAVESHGMDPGYVIDLLSRMQTTIATAPDLHTLQEASAYSQALRELLDKLDAGLSLINAATAVRLTAERRLGQSLAPLERGPGRQRGGGLSDYNATLQDLGVQPRLARYWKAVAAIPDALFDAYVMPAIEAVQHDIESDAPISRRGLLRYYRDRTPGEPRENDRARAGLDALLVSVGQALGGIDLAIDGDAEGASDTEWAGRVWLDAIGDGSQDATASCVAAWTEDRVLCALVRVPVRPGAGWWSLFAGHPVCLLRPDAVGSTGMTAGAVFALGVEADVLGTAFHGMGWTYPGVITP